jgi:N-acetyl-gamma-glutamyl-phosphate reductase
MTTVHVAGAAGYAAAEFIRLAEAHPDLRLGVLESGSHAGQELAAHLPGLRRSTRTFDPPGSALAAVAPGDAVVLAGNAESARETAPAYLAAGARVIDLSDAFRLQAGAGEAIYGLPERYRSAIRNARLVANPGCYPTATLLALLPLAALAKDIEQVIVDAKSGITGAGRTPATSSLFAEVDGDVRAYGLHGHRHQREIEQELLAAGIAAPLIFTPQVVPVRRGILACCYAVFAREPDDADVAAAFKRAYGASLFVRVLPPDRPPNLVALCGTNDVELNVARQGRVVRIIAGIDNLGKGAAGQALQNLNLMLGFPEERGLDDRAVAV